MARIATLITWHGIAGTWPSFEELRTRLSSYRLESVLPVLSRLSAMLKTWQNDFDPSLDVTLSRQFLPTYSSAIERIRRVRPNGLVFSRLSILFALKQACLACPLDGIAAGSVNDVERILSCCLMSNDLLLARMPTDQDSTIEKAASLLPFSDYVPKDTYPKDLARSLLLFNTIGPTLRANSDFIDLAAEFRRIVGVTPEEYCDLAFCASVKFITNVQEQLQDPINALILKPDYFRLTSLPTVHVSEVLSGLSWLQSDIKQVASKSTLGADFILFQQKPLIKISDSNFLCPDPGFLLDKAGRSLYWTLHFGVTSERRQLLMSFWGTVFEKYMEWLFEQSYQGRSELRFAPRFNNGDESFDAYLLEGSSLIVFEFKASVLSIHAKYGFSSDKLRQELTDKVIEGPEGKRKGLAQIRASLMRFLGGDSIPGLDPAAIKTVYPVLVFLDRSFVAPYLNLFYNENFDRVSVRYAFRRTITPAFTLTVNDLENILPYTNKHKISDILDSFWHENRKMYGSLSQSSVPLLRKEVPGVDPVGDWFNSFADSLEQRLFSKPE